MAHLVDKDFVQRAIPRCCSASCGAGLRPGRLCPTPFSFSSLGLDLLLLAYRPLRGTSLMLRQSGGTHFWQ
jgi:hypothetical protein